MFFTEKEGIFREEQPMSNKLIDLIDISKSYGMQTVLDELDTLHQRKRIPDVFLEPSRCGKTDYTSYFSGGFETHLDKGRVYLLMDRTLRIFRLIKRQLDTVFQKYALFTHMNIAE